MIAATILICQLCGEATARAGAPVTLPGCGGVVMACPVCVAAQPTRTFCNDGATLEPWTLADLREANAGDPELPTWDAALAALAVGETYSIGIGGGVTVVTRLS